MKKILSLVLAITLVLGSFSFAFAATDDVTGHENEAAIRRLVELGLVEGDSRGIRPNDTITRAEFAAMVVRALGKESVAKYAAGATDFIDVPAEHWASGYIKVASTMGLVDGYGDGNFGPSDPITYEQALALLVRALGYTPEALEKGGYPIGYLVVADDLDLEFNADGAAGLQATRATVFQMLDNALTVDMMEQEGFGEDKTYKVVEGKTLLGGLGYDKVTARVTDINTSDLEITLEDEGDFEVSEGFEFEKAYGLEISAWVDDDEVVIYEINEEPMFDAVSGAEDEITLVSADKDYDVAKDATLILNGEEVDAEDFDADYAKVVLNDEDEVIWAQGFTFTDFLVVKEVEDGIAYSYDGDELDLDEDYTVVKDGEEITSEDVDADDILFFNEDEGYAVVYNNSEDGELERVYTDSFKFEGNVYYYDAGNYDAKYLDGDELDVVNDEVLDAMMDEDENVTVYFDFAGNAILVVGDQGEPDTDFFYGVVNYFNNYTDTKYDKEYYVLEVLNEEGDLVEYDLLAEDFVNLADYKPVDSTGPELIKKVVKVTVNEDGDVEEVDVLTNDGKIDNTNEENGIEIDAVYADGFRLKDDAIVFWAEGQDDVEDYTVMKWSEVEDEFGKVLDADVYASGGRVAVLFVTDTDADTADTDYTGLVTKVRELKSGDVWEITIEVNGEEFEYLTDKDEIVEDDVKDILEKIVTISIGNKSGEVKEINDSPKSESIVIEELSTSADTITATVTEDVYELVEDAVIYDKTDDFAELTLRDLEEGDTVSVYFVNEDTERFVNYVVRTALADPDNNDTVGEEGTITYINSTFTKIVVDGKTTYTFDSNTEILDEDGNIIAVGYEDIEHLSALEVDDVVTDIKVEDGVVKSLVLVSQE